MYKKLSFILLMLALSQSGQAADSNSGCRHLHLQISNQTKDSCILTSQKLIRGNLISPPPSSIIPNDSKAFDMEQSVYGPEVLLSYQCGDETISIKSQQNYCFAEAGNITGTVLSPLPRNLKASYTALIGSFFWDKPGNINWTFLKSS